MFKRYVGALAISTKGTIVDVFKNFFGRILYRTAEYSSFQQDLCGASAEYQANKSALW